MDYKTNADYREDAYSDLLAFLGKNGTGST